MAHTGCLLRPRCKPALLLVMLIATGCAGASAPPEASSVTLPPPATATAMATATATPPSMSTTPTVTVSASEPAATPDAAQPAYTSVEIAELAIALDVPADWRRLDPAWAWARGAADFPQVEVLGRALPPPFEVEAALLPGPSQVLDSTPVTLAWGAGRQITIEIYGAQPVSPGVRAPVIAVERHVLVVAQRDGGRFAWDIVARAQTVADLAALDEVYQHMVASSRLLAQP